MAEFKAIAPKPLSETGSKTEYSTVGKSTTEKLKGGRADGKPDEEFDPEQLKAGIKVEREHTSDPQQAKEVAKDHLSESPDYYKRLAVMEAEAKSDVKKSLQRANSLVKALKSSLNEEDMDLKKTDDEDEEKETEKSLSPLAVVVKALKASSIAGLTRRQRMDAAYRAGSVIGSHQAPIYAEPVSLREGELGVAPQELRPDYEPPVVPIRKVETPFAIAPKKCGDHTYKSAKVDSTESKPFWRR